MPDTKEQQILEAIETRLKGIDGTGNYNLDFDDRVAIWKTNWQADEGDSISIFTGDADAQDAPTQRGKVQFQLPVIIEATLQHVLDGGGEDATYQKAQQAIADIKLAISLDDRWTVSGVGLAQFSLDAGHTVIREPNSHEIAGVQIRMTVQYIVQKFNSYQ